MRQESATRRSLYSAHMNLAQRAWEMDNVGGVLDLLNQHRPEPGREDLRGFEWYHLWHLCHGARLTVSDHQGAVTSVAFAPNGRLLATAGEDLTVKLRDPGTLLTLTVFGKLTEPVQALVFSPDSKTLVTAEGGTVKLWDVASRQERASPAKAAGPGYLRGVRQRWRDARGGRRKPGRDDLEHDERANHLSERPRRRCPCGRLSLPTGKH